MTAHRYHCTCETVPHAASRAMKLIPRHTSTPLTVTVSIWPVCSCTSTRIGPQRSIIGTPAGSVVPNTVASVELYADWLAAVDGRRRCKRAAVLPVTINRCTMFNNNTCSERFYKSGFSFAGQSRTDRWRWPSRPQRCV